MPNTKGAACRALLSMDPRAICRRASFLPEREMAAARTRNCSRTNTKLFPHEHEIIFARTRNYFRTNTKCGTNCGTNSVTKCDTKCRTKSRARNCHANVSSGFWFLGARAGRARHSQTSPGNQFRALFAGPFRAATLGPFRAGNFARAISCRQFRAGNFAPLRRSPGRPCASAAASEPDRLRLGRRRGLPAASISPCRRCQNT